MKSAALFLSTVYSSWVKVHPVVIFSIVEHYARRNEGQQRTIGTLLGTNNDGLIEIKNSFPVPHSESDQVAVDIEVFKRMFDLHVKANPKEVIVGWYATGTEITENSLLIHDFYWREIGHSPIHLLVDTGLNGGNMDIKAYTSTTLSPWQWLGTDGPKEKSASEKHAITSMQFLPVRLELESADSERIGLEVLARGRGEGATVSRLASELENLEVCLTQLSSLLTTVSNYTDRVVKGEIAGDNNIGRFLVNTVSSLPLIEADSYDKMFNNSLQDLLMVTYLSNLTRTQLALAERSGKLMKDIVQ